jgi:hypothetical protein
MPPEQSVRRRDRGDLAQGGTAYAVRVHAETTTLVVREAQPTPTNLLPQDPVFSDQVREGVPLATT